MKYLINQTQDDRNGSLYQVWAELVPCSSPPGTQFLTISSRWTGSKDPNAFQKKFEMLLDQDAQANLIDLLDTNGST
jgi:hypothetical protein